MTLDRSLIALIAKKHPAIWEIVGPYGPLNRGIYTALNPQPLPPVALGRADRHMFNPQPDPPGFAYGMTVGAELVRAAGLAQMLHIGFDLEVDDICPPPKEWPPIPWPPVPWPWRATDGIDPDYDIGYAIGLAFALESSAHGWERLDGAAMLERVHEVAFKTAEAGMR